MSGNSIENDARLQETDFVPPEQVSGDNDGPAGQDAEDSDGRLNSNGYGSITPSAKKTPTASARVLAPDLLRGLLMVFQSLDHSALAFGAWRHGVALESESDGQVVTTWNSPTAWTVRMLTHLCAPGFMFLLGMGVVYFGRSRSKLGWTTGAMIWHFAVRGVVLILINELIGLGLGRGQFVILNIVLWALAVNYFLAGLLWVLINSTEHWLAVALSSLPSFQDGESSRPLLENGSADTNASQQTKRPTSRALSISWHVHNFSLLGLAVLTIWWNVLLSPDGGHCSVDLSSPHLRPDGNVTRLGIWFDFWFYPVRTKLIMSGFPPLAWLSFAILGLLYGRAVTARTWRAGPINASNAAMGVVFFALFAATRLLHIGNLSEDCLRMPAEQHGDNQYLASFRAFFYITKYPPSVSYLCFTMSLIHFFLALFGALPPAIFKVLPLSILMTFGTSALFFYVAHLVLYMVPAILIVPRLGHDLGWTDPMTGGPAVGFGNSWQYWLLWVTGLVILVPLCGWYGRFKSSKGPNSIWRFF